MNLAELNVAQAPMPTSSQDAPVRTAPAFMLVPSLACPAECRYCFGPHRGTIMSPPVAEEGLDFIARVAADTGAKKVKVIFHGGELLVAGHALFRQCLEGLRDRFGSRGCKVSIQSNLWLLDDEFCRLFVEHGVEVGTSLDGPEPITDAQRGPGYFGRTMAGIRRAQAHGLHVGCIATFTPDSAPRWREVFDFFRSERLNFSIHPAVSPLRGGVSPYRLPPEAYCALLRKMLDAYLVHRRELAIESLD